MSKYSPATWQSVKKKASDIRDYIPNVPKRKAEVKIKCPMCGAEAFSVVHKAGKNFAFCHACDFSLPDALAAVKHFQGLDDDAALEYLARAEGMIIETEQERRARTVREIESKPKKYFYQQQLEGSGLTEIDTLANIVEDNQEHQASPFRKGRLDTESWKPDPSGDDMLIYYYGLDGHPMTYRVKGSSIPRPYVRVRWSNPDIHTSKGDKSGKGMKYQTPAGARSRVYIPQRIRTLYQSGIHIETLFLQEGEKKAEKACKHGMLSIGIQGINNFGSAEEGLLQDIQDIAQRCSIKNVVLIMDSDWNDLSKNLTVGERVDKRPNSFARAVIKFQQFMKTLYNIGLAVDTWWGHVNENDHGDKGVDDLLAGSLKGREAELIDGIKYAMNAHDGHSQWINIHRITASTENQIRSFWKLDDHNAFFDAHKDRLADLAVFRIGPVRYRIEEGALVPMSAYASDSDIFSISEKKDGEEKVDVNMVETMNFLRANGYFRIRLSDNPESGYQFINLDNGIIDISSGSEIRTFVYDYIMSSCKRLAVQEAFTRKLSMWLADKQLERLSIVEGDFNNFAPGVQRTYYNNGQVEITASDITPGKPINNVWRSRIVPRDFRRVPIIKSISKVGDDFYIEFSEEAKHCEFLTYLQNTSNTFYPHNAWRELEPAERKEFLQQLINKITTIGYMLCDYKYASERKAVIIVDHNMSEVGQSFGGVGKSILGNAIGRIYGDAQTKIDGKSIKSDDQFLLAQVTKATRNIFIDDVRPNFDFERIFVLITGDMTVRQLNQNPYTIKAEESPKILVATNHAINKSDEGSVKRRIAYMEFSAWYNADHTPMDDFGHMLFDEWDDEQWCLFDNLMAECAMYYLRSFEENWPGKKGQGAVPPPMKNIELRALRQKMSEVLYQWADAYFDPSSGNLNNRLKRQDIMNAFLEFAAGSSQGVTRSNFKDKIKAFCRFKGYDFNPDKPNADGTICADWRREHPGEPFVGSDDKSGGAEYFTVFSLDHYKTTHPF